MRSIDDIDEDEPTPIVVAQAPAAGAASVMDDLFGPPSSTSSASPVSPSAAAASSPTSSSTAQQQNIPKKPDALDDFFGGGGSQNKSSSSGGAGLGGVGTSSNKPNDVFDSLFASPSSGGRGGAPSSSSSAASQPARPTARSAIDHLDAFSAVMSGGAAPWTSTTSVADSQAVGSGDRVFVPPDSVLSLMTLYDVVGAAQNWSTDDIAKAYKKKALALHPDKLQGGRTEAEDRYFKIITAAYEVLKDSERRAEYDMALKTGSGSSSASWLNFVA